MKRVLMSAVFLAVAPVTIADVLHVPEEYDIREAMSMAEAGDTVLVACGEYMVGRPGIELKSGVCLLSETGDPSCATIFGIPLDCTLLEAQGVDNTARVEGFTLWPRNGSCAVFDDSSPICHNCYFLSNDPAYSSVACCGSSSGPVFDHCVFEGFSTVLTGYVDSLEVTDCRFTDNDQGVTDLWGNRFRAVRCTFEGARLYDYPLMQLAVNDIALHSCTIANNEKDGASGVMIYAYWSDVFHMENTLIASNTGFDQIFYSYGSEPSIEINCCDIWGNTGGDWVGEISNLYGVNGNISEDPLFCGNLNPLDPFLINDLSPCAPFSPPDPECDLIGSRPIGCGASNVEIGEQDLLPQLIDAAYPNPSTGVVDISFTTILRPGGQAQISIFDAQGRRVRRFSVGMPAEQPATVRWNGCDDLGKPVPTGIYTCRVNIDGRKANQSIVIIR